MDSQRKEELINNVILPDDGSRASPQVTFESLEADEKYGGKDLRLADSAGRWEWINEEIYV